jgi:hypothetical protein
MQVFLSYAEADKAYAEKLARALQKELDSRDFKVWYHDWELLPGDNWAQKLGEALEESEAMVVVVSPAAAKSEWVQREIQYALGSENYSGRLIPVILKPAADIPWILESMHMVPAAKDPVETSRRIARQLTVPARKRALARQP